MRDQVIIRLSTSAMNNLFPEGSDARVELQNSVLSEISGRFMKNNITKEMTELLTALSAEVMREVNPQNLIDESFKRLSHYPVSLGLKPESAMGKALHKAVDERFKSEVYDQIHDMVSAKGNDESFKSFIEKQVTYEVNAQLGKIVSSEVRRRTELGLKAALSAPYVQDADKN